MGEAAACFVLAEKVRTNRRIFDSQPTSFVTRKEQYRVDQLPQEPVLVEVRLVVLHVTIVPRN